MLNILGRSTGKFCDGLSRRELLQIGSLGFGGLTLPELLRAEARAGETRSHKAVIMIFLPGGPPHQDMWDLKPDAPQEIRGEFNPIATNVPGTQIGELFPRMAGMADKLTFIRSIVGAAGPHYAFQCHTSRHNVNQPAGGWPSMGAWISRLQGPVSPDIPAHISLCYKTSHAPWGDPGQGGFLGVGHGPFRLAGGPADQGLKADDMTLNGITLERLQDRRQLLSSFDRFRRDTDSRGLMEGMDSFAAQAFGVLTSSRMVEAIDLSKEDPAVVARYGQGDVKYVDDGAPLVVQNFLVARRLVEAGARMVTLNFGRWDWHGQNFSQARRMMPMLDQGVAALVGELHERGLQHDVSVVVWGEFGRTPKINNGAGRDHWPQVSCAMLAGGGLRHGQVIGATNRLGEVAVDRPVHFAEVHATLYKSLGMDSANTRVFDLRGRPQYLVDEGYHPIRELV